MLSLAFDAISEHAADHVEVHERLVSTIGRIAEATSDPGRRQALRRQLEIAVACAGRAGTPAHRFARFHALCEQERARVAAPIATGSPPRSPSDAAAASAPEPSPATDRG